MNPFQSFREYEEYVYALQQQFPAIKSSTLIVIRKGKRVATLQGELLFEQGYRIVSKERLSCDFDSVIIESYGYEIWCGNEKEAWYDSQPHPDEPSLISSHPHHKHVPPDMKHNRIPAPQMNFTRPNLPELIQEVEESINAANEEK